MEINGRQIAEIILGSCKKELASLVKEVGHKPKLVVISVRPHSEDFNFIKSKQRAAEKIGATFELVSFKKVPRFEEFAVKIRDIADNAKNTAIVIQEPLPSQLITDTLYNYIPLEKEIEGHKYKSPFFPPIGLAVLTILKSIFDPTAKRSVSDLVINQRKDSTLFKSFLRRKKVVLIGKGTTGGKPIGTTLTAFKVNYINTHSKTPLEASFYTEADIIISAVGKKVVFPIMLKNGVILISVGIRQTTDGWKGDYDEKEISSIASAFTPTPGGIGPVDIAYLMCNVVQAFRIQQERK